jgi:hypothetical protein
MRRLEQRLIVPVEVRYLVAQCGVAGDYTVEVVGVDFGLDHRLAPARSNLATEPGRRLLCEPRVRLIASLLSHSDLSSQGGPIRIRDDLADLPARFEITMRIDNLVEWKDSVDDWLQGAFL